MIDVSQIVIALIVTIIGIVILAICIIGYIIAIAIKVARRIQEETKQTISQIQEETKQTISQTQEETQQALEEERNKVDKLKLALKNLNLAYRKNKGVSENSATLGMSLSLVNEGSPEHVQGVSQDSLYQMAKRLAKEAGFEIEN